jgi:hypothetical protein
MKISTPGYSCIIIVILLLLSCSSKLKLKQEKFVVAKGFEGYCAVFYGDNYGAIEDTSDVRVFNFDSTGIVFTRLRLNTNGNLDLFLRKNDNSFDTLRRLLYSNDKLDENSIYTSRVLTLSQLQESKELFIYVFYVGVPSSDPGKEEFLLDRKLDSIAKANYFLK